MSTGKDEAREKVHAALVRIRETASAPAQFKLSESDTRSGFLEPLFEALGYDRIADIRREVYIPDNKERLDFHLYVDSQPRLIVEAKAFAHALTPADGIQAINYANILGSQWAVATNGRQWRLYNQYSNAPAADKLVMELDLAVWDEATFPDLFEQLWLVSKESCRQGALEVWQQSRSLDRALRAILADPKSKGVAAVRRQLDDEHGIKVGPTEIVDWMVRSLGPVSVDPPAPAPVTPAAQPPMAPAASTRAPKAPPKGAPPHPLAGIRFTGEANGVVNASGHLLEDGRHFVVHAGSTADPRTRESMGATIHDREALVADGSFVPEGDRLRLTRDHTFTSSSAAAKVLVGCSWSGPGWWKDSEGRLLKGLLEGETQQ